MTKRKNNKNKQNVNLTYSKKTMTPNKRIKEMRYNNNN